MQTLDPIRPERRTLRRQGVYLLPNLFTLAALFAGFYAIVQGMNKNFEYAAVAIFIAMILDGMDGRVARLTHSQSAFGAEFDSLSDMVSFGVAPALVAYEWMLNGLGKLGWMVAFIYCAGAALRLARFNTMIGIADKRWFIGIPSPAAAALVAGLVWICHEYRYNDLDILPWVALGFTAFAGVSMVTNVRFWSFKELHLRRKVPFVTLLLVVLGILLLVSKPPLVLFGFFVCYALSGYLMALARKLRPARPAA
ncbi:MULTISPECIES: CDP-diacylglycerol--serine O-phosphatidyltransferase [Gulbenkiania]|uniref:CDP-diacylglycerol--serine O-phosphatidyltransferase n=2 Tax=Gulbenkiania TaxID=397456 RepID=A0A0K6GTM9_9NEIS|nr:MULTISPECIES: CDP-diacylglycerol--serine O-phosphatidyltransferase [Gulbenkiania]TCW31876.1 CDP-diacylglycerol--serine O-phosphatidyltransferase [Gulbenkiania mobilis]CUA81972.1 CDP-diacylglycerol--serine O-phosphatidyltransferase [Gulbenkiania indica]